jgi:hypothetical protein
VYTEEGTGAPQTRPELSGLSPEQVQAWAIAYTGRPVGPDDVKGGVPVDDSIIAIDVGDGGKRYFRKNSCFAVGEQAVVGDLKEWRSVDASIQAMRNEVSDKTEDDATWLSAQSKWIGCMRADGFGSTTLQQHKAALVAAASSGREPVSAVKADEIAVATASAKCEVTLGIGITYQEVQSRIEQQVADANQATIIRFKELQQQAAQRASDRLTKR